MVRSRKKTADHITAVENWLHRQGYSVIFERGIESQIHPKTPRRAENKKSKKEVWVDSAPSLECQLHTILHEAGHLVVESQKDYYEKYSHGYPIKGSSKARTIRHVVHIIHEEFNAWEEGLKLAHRLKIPIRKKVWESHRCPALMGYFRNSDELTKRKKN